MQKTSIILMIIILGFSTFILSSSGCIDTNPVNKTFGEKKISLDLLKVQNDSETGSYFYEGENYFYVQGNITNYNPIDALNVKINATFYDAKGKIIKTNNKVYIYLEPKSIPAKDKSSYYIEVKDPNQQIVSCKVNVISAKAEI